MQIQLNGEARAIPDETSIRDLICLLNLPKERVAIEVNGVVVRRAEWGTTILLDDDRVEIVHFVGGGSCVRC